MGVVRSLALVLICVFFFATSVRARCGKHYRPPVGARVEPGDGRGSRGRPAGDMPLIDLDKVPYVGDLPGGIKISGVDGPRGRSGSSRGKGALVAPLSSWESRESRGSGIRNMGQPETPGTERRAERSLAPDPDPIMDPDSIPKEIAFPSREAPVAPKPEEPKPPRRPAAAAPDPLPVDEGPKPLL